MQTICGITTDDILQYDVRKPDLQEHKCDNYRIVGKF